MMISEEKKKEYLEAEGMMCPHCGSDDLSWDAMEVSGFDGSSWQDVECNSCSKAWKDIYKLADIYEDD